MKSEYKTRRKRISEEISDALDDLGISKKEFAARMHRQPSEVTRWLSGDHNFTSDLLEEMSIVLGRPVSGATDGLIDTKILVSGYELSGVEAPTLNEPSSSVTLERIQLPSSLYISLADAARKKGETLREFIVETLCQKAKESSSSIFDFCGIMDPDFPDAEELRSYRTDNNYPDL